MGLGQHPKNLGPLFFLKPLKLATSNVVHNLGLRSRLPKTTFRTGRGMGYGVSYTPNLKLVTSTVAEMSRGPKILGVLP